MASPYILITLLDWYHTYVSYSRLTDKTLIIYIIQMYMGLDHMMTVNRYIIQSRIGLKSTPILGTNPMWQHSSIITLMSVWI